MLTGSFVLSEIIFKMSLPPVNFTVKIMIRQIQDELLIGNDEFDIPSFRSICLSASCEIL